MIQIIYRHKIAPGTEAGFLEAWERCKAKMLGRVQGLLDASIFRNATDANELVSISRWASVDDWKSYWGAGVPDPEGELPKNEILIELKTIAPAPEGTAKGSKRSAKTTTRKH